MTALKRRIVAFWNGRPTSAALRASDRSEGAEVGPSLLASKFDLPQGSNCWTYLTFEFLIDIERFATRQVFL